MDKLESWMRGFLMTVVPECAVDFDTVSSFINITEPKAHDTGYVQCGVECGTSRQNKLKEDLPIYPTFSYSDKQHSWIYRGLCFANASYPRLLLPGI